MNKGYYGLILYRPKTIENLGGILRSAHCFNCNYIVLIENRYRRQKQDTTNALKHIPSFYYSSFEEFYHNRNHNTKLIGVEVNGKGLLNNFCHNLNTEYLLGGENVTIPESILSRCDYTIKLDTSYCLNLAVCASILMYDRQTKLRL